MLASFPDIKTISHSPRSVSLSILFLRCLRLQYTLLPHWLSILISQGV